MRSMVEGGDLDHRCTWPPPSVACGATFPRVAGEGARRLAPRLQKSIPASSASLILLAPGRRSEIMTSGWRAGVGGPEVVPAQVETVTVISMAEGSTGRAGAAYPVQMRGGCRQRQGLADRFRTGPRPDFVEPRSTQNSDRVGGAPAHSMRTTRSGTEPRRRRFLAAGQRGTIRVAAEAEARSSFLPPLTRERIAGGGGALFTIDPEGRCRRIER
jgi:hypothetical protein